MPVNNGDGIQKDVLLWSTSDLSGPPTFGSSFTVTGAPDLMSFKDDEAVVQPSNLDSGGPDTFEPNQTLSGTLEGQEFRGNHGTTDVFEFEIAYQVTDGVNTFNVYQIHNAQYGGTTTAYVSEVTLEPDTTYTVVAQDNSVNFANGGYEATPSWSDLAGQVEGTSGDDVIGAGYADDDDDRVDRNDGDNDVIVGEGGGDTITAGAGDDLVYGDHVDDLPAGTTEYIAQGFIRDLNFELESGSLAFTDHTVSISGAPVEFRFVDHDGVTLVERQ